MRCWDFFFFKQKTAYEMRIRLEFRRVLFRSRSQNACGVQPGRSDGRIAMKSGTKIVLVALAAGALGVVASIVTNGPGPLLGTEAGQRVVQEAYRATAPAPPPGVTVAGRGDTIPAFTVPGLDGTPVDVSVAWAGKPMLINIWASWCGPCLEAMPELQRDRKEAGVGKRG